MGALEVNLRRLGRDSYSASAHKSFCGPKEAGLWYVRWNRIEQIWPRVVVPGVGAGMHWRDASATGAAA
jgi:selenocysteine lyase/cysteine desulfurase